MEDLEVYYKIFINGGKMPYEHVSEPIHAAVPKFVVLNHLEQLRVPTPNSAYE